MDTLKLDPEKDDGNIEYKRKIEPEYKRDKLGIQMVWRVNEGHRLNGIYEAIYFIGVDDDGTIAGLTDTQLGDSITNFEKIVDSYEMKINSIKIHETKLGHYAKLIVRKMAMDDKNEIRIGLLGDSNTGKTTLIGVLTYGFLDNGEGLSRSNILRYRHEFNSGITTSISHDIMGFNKDNKTVNYSDPFILSWEDIVNNSEKIINLIDMPGSISYIDTIIFGILTQDLDYVLITATDDSKIDHLVKICDSFNIRYIVITTKIDIGKSIKLEQKFIPIKNHKDIFEKDDTKLIKVSNKTGEGVDFLKSIIAMLPRIKRDCQTTEKDVEFVINKVYYVTDIGTIVSGILKQGRIKTGDHLLIGPESNCNKTCHAVKIITIHKKQCPCEELKSGESGSILVSTDKKIKITKHMKIISSSCMFNFHNSFKILLIGDNRPLKIGLKLHLHVNNIKDIIQINGIDSSYIEVSFIDDHYNYVKNNENCVIKYDSDIICGKCIIG